MLPKSVQTKASSQDRLWTINAAAMRASPDSSAICATAPSHIQRTIGMGFVQNAQIKYPNTSI
jgi:hypothetical protein